MKVISPILNNPEIYNNWDFFTATNSKIVSLKKWFIN
jgi:hypothetical protein